jgi:hypothetical protein
MREGGQVAGESAGYRGGGHVPPGNLHLHTYATFSFMSRIAANLRASASIKVDLNMHSRSVSFRVGL